MRAPPTTAIAAGLAMTGRRSPSEPDAMPSNNNNSVPPTPIAKRFIASFGPMFLPIMCSKGQQAAAGVLSWAQQ